jgi:putative two-component system response regulator
MPATILIADDHESSLLGLEGLLSLEGYKVKIAHDGKSALEEFYRLQPDMVLLDVQMPGMTGIEVCRHIKSCQDSQLVPVVLITALTATQDRVAGIKAGADDFLTKPVDREQLTARVRVLLKQKAYTDELERAEAVLFALARSIEAKDRYTEGHCERLADYSAELAIKLGLPPEEVKALRRSGVVHDIGKVAVPDTVLLKRGPLNRKEWEVMRQHPLVGERICAPLKSFQLVLPVIRHHHEKMNGTGYPDGLKGDQIPLTARILSIVDVYDALTTSRPYKDAIKVGKALGIMEEEVKKGWWDASLFREFVALVQNSGEPAERHSSRVKMAAAGHD